jgi:hypothetical protein
MENKINKRTQILLTEKQYKKLKKISASKKTSIGCLIRDAIDKVFMNEIKDKRKIIDEIKNMDLPVGNWENMKKEILKGKYRQ